MEQLCVCAQSLVENVRGHSTDRESGRGTGEWKSNKKREGERESGIIGDRLGVREVVWTRGQDSLQQLLPLGQMNHLLSQE